MQESRVPVFALKRLRVTYTDALRLSACFHRDNPKAKGTTSEPRKKGKEKKARRGFQGECTRHVLHYMQPCDCFPDSGWTGARIHGQTTFDDPSERKGVSSGIPSLIYSRGTRPSSRTFSQSLSLTLRGIYTFIWECWESSWNWIEKKKKRRKDGR